MKKKFTELFSGKRKYKSLYYTNRNKAIASRSERLVFAIFATFIIFGLGTGIGLFHTTEQGAIISALQQGYIYAFISDNVDLSRIWISFTWLLLPMFFFFTAGYSRLCVQSSSLILFARSVLSGYGIFALFSALGSFGFFKLFLFALLVLLEVIMLLISVSFAQTAFFHSDYLFRNSVSLRKSLVTGQFSVDGLFFCGLLIIIFFLRAALARML